MRHSALQMRGCVRCILFDALLISCEVLSRTCPQSTACCSLFAACIARTILTLLCIPLVLTYRLLCILRAVQVGAALSMVYTSGAPIMFVGCGQTYPDLKRLNVKSVVKSLLK
jgi:hypothetical protein